MRVAVVAVEGMVDSGLAVLLDVLATADELGVADGGPRTEPLLVAAGPEVRTGRGLLVPATPVAELDRTPDVVVAPALGPLPPERLLRVVRGHPVLGCLRHWVADGARPAAAASGVLFLAEAGLLDGVEATTSRRLAGTLAAHYPKVRLDVGRTLVDLPEALTAGPVLAHLDLGLALVRRQSPELAERVAGFLVAGDHASLAGGSVPPELVQADPVLAAFERWVWHHLDDAVSMPRAAAAVGVSERTLERRTRALLGVSPSDLVQDIRIEQAVHLLRTTRMTPEAVAAAVGYSSVASLRGLVRRRRGETLTRLSGRSRGFPIHRGR